MVGGFEIHSNREDSIYGMTRRPIWIGFHGAPSMQYVFLFVGFPMFVTLTFKLATYIFM